jgi:hypothetical protein
MKRFLPVNTFFIKGIILSDIVTWCSFYTSSSVRILITIFTSFICLTALSQSVDTKQEEAYRKIVTKRSQKILDSLHISDPEKKEKVLADISNQYIRLNNIHESHKNAVDTLKKRVTSPEELSGMLKNEQQKRDDQLLALHENYISTLKQSLTTDQLEKVKDGMTYNVLPLTYRAYQEMIPQLTTVQKSKILAWLMEARELAMDEGSSEKKHGVFGKYKGRINNYLSAAGYDLKKETLEWQKRLKEEKGRSD